VAEGAYNEEEEDIEDDWENELQEKSNAPVRNKRTKEEIQKQREQEAAEAAVKKAQQEKELNEDPLEKRKRLEKIQVKNDIEATHDLFGIEQSIQQMNLRSIPTDTKLSELLSNPDFTPKTKQEFDQYAKALAEKLVRFKPVRNATLYVQFLEVLFRELGSSIDYVDIRKLSSMLSTLSNEKQRAEKDKKGKKNTKKAQVKLEATSTALADEEDYDAGYDEFM
jgi:translation initiation factor 3 subunit J